MEYTIIRSVSDIPIIPGAIYIFDIDETILSTYEDGRSTAYDENTIPWMYKVASTSPIIYLTARLPKDKEGTVKQLLALGYPPGILLTAGPIPKGKVLQAYGGEHKGPIIFADDLEHNLFSVKQTYPQTVIYRMVT